MKEQILDYIKKHPSTSFAELSNRIDGFNGDYALPLSDTITSVILWNSMSKEAADAISELAKAKLITIKQADPLIYYVDGKVPNMPVATRAINYKKPRWLPVHMYAGDV